MSSSYMPRHATAMWVDSSNITRTRIVPTRRLVKEPNFCVMLTNAIQGLPAMGDSAFDSPVGEVSLSPDSGHTLHNIGRWMHGTGAFFGDMRLENGTLEWMHCPRSFLRRQVTRLREQFGVTPTVGFELEFQLLEKNTLTPIDNSVYCSMKAFHDGRAWSLLKEIVECLEDDLHIPVHQYHAESASGQLEISTGVFGLHDGAETIDVIVDAVDKLVLARQTIYAMAAQRGLQATLLPKLKLDQAGSAAHIHIGLLDLASRHNLFTTDGVRATAFLAGIVEELPSLCMLLAPTVNSYDRLQPKCWAGAYQCYGYENREAPIRLVGPSSARNDLQHVDHFEIKTLDGTANPYLTLGAVLAAGMSGMDRKLKLPLPCNQDPATMAETDRPALLPRSLDEAIEKFEAQCQPLWNSVLSASYTSLLVTLRKAEAAYYSALDRTEQIQALVERY